MAEVCQRISEKSTLREGAELCRGWQARGDPVGVHDRGDATGGTASQDELIGRLTMRFGQQVVKDLTQVKLACEDKLFLS
jgi:hypothetical protein